MARSVFSRTPSIVVEKSPWQTLFESIPDMLYSFQNLKIQAQEKEKDRQFRESQLYLKDMLDTRKMLQKSAIDAQNTAREKGATMDFELDKIFSRSPEHTTNNVQNVAQDYKTHLQNQNNDILASIDRIDNETKLANMGARAAIDIDENFNGKVDISEIENYQKNNPGILKEMGVDQLPQSYVEGAKFYLGQPKVRKSRQALYDLNEMVRERVKDTDPDTPGLQWDPKDPRNDAIQNTLDMIQLQNIPAAAAALKKIVKPKDPFAVEPYGKLSSRMLESEGMIVKEDPYLGDVVKRIDQATGDTLDVSPQEAAKIIMGKRDQYKLAEEMKTKVALADKMEDKRKDDFDAEQATRYKAAHNWFKSGPLKTSRTSTGEYKKGTPGWVKDIFEESDILYSLLAKPDWHPTASQKHESPEAIKGYQAEIEKYIAELMTKSGYKPDSDLQTVFASGNTARQGARNVLNSPKFQTAVDPKGDGNIDTKEASKNLNELFDLHGMEMFGLDEASLAQGEAIAHLYNVWNGLESELLERKRHRMQRTNEQLKFERIYSGQ
jgi:hypothetical protein